MLAPKKSKFRKSHKLRRGGKVSRKNHLSFGSYGLKSLSAHWVSSRQIEAARRVISRYLTKTGKMWIRIFPDAPVTAKGGEIPMGKGKGSVDHYVAKLKAGTIMFEVDGLGEAEAKTALLAAAHKLPIPCAFIKK